MFSSNSRKLAEEIMGMDENTQAIEIFNKLEKRGYRFEPYTGIGRQFKGVYCLDNASAAIARLEQTEGNQTYYLPVIMNMDIYTVNIAGGKANVRAEPRRDGGPRIIVEVHERDEHGSAPRPVLWHLVTGWPDNAPDDLATDHKRNNTLINLRDELRICTRGDNNRNSPKFGTFENFKEFDPANADEYTYSLARDCSHTLYAYVLMLLGDITEKQLDEINIIVNSYRLFASDFNEKLEYLESHVEAGII